MAGRDVRGHPHPHQVVHDKAVEQTAEEILRERRSGVRRQKTVCVETQRGRQNRRDERRPVARAGDVAVCQPRAIEVLRFQATGCLRDGDSVLAPLQMHAEWLDVFAFHDRQAARSETATIVCRVQFSAELCRPASLAADRRKERRGSFGDRDIQGRPKLRNRQSGSREAFHKRRAQTDAKPI